MHESAHAWTADRLGDPTARERGRVSLNPIVHADLIGTVIFPLLALIGNLPLIGWAKPVPVNVRRLHHPRRDYVIVAAAGPASNLLLALSAAIGLWLMPVSPVILGEPNVTAPVASLLSGAMQINVLLARLGEVARLREIERLPFDRKLDAIRAWLREAQRAAETST